MNETYNPCDNMLDRAAGMLGLKESDYVALKYPRERVCRQ
jgi:hypothetical protein